MNHWRISRPESVLLPIVLTLWFGHATTSAGGAQTVFRPEKLVEMDAAINEAIADKRCPGGVLWFEHHGITYHKAYGHRALVPSLELMTKDTIFDAASLTKVVACTPAMMLLVE